MKSIEMERGKFYKVISNSTDKTVLIDDIVCIDKNEALWKGKSSDGSQSGWIDAEDLTMEILDFEVDELNI
jgi:hypothetical protein